MGTQSALTSSLLIFALSLLALQASAGQQTDSPVGRLSLLCAKGEISPDLEGAARVVLMGELAQSASFSSLPKDFLPWLAGTKQLLDQATLAMATVGPKVAWNLQLLRERDEGLVERYPGLATAYAAAWARGDDAVPRRFWVDDWLVRGRDVPDMFESFLYHIERRRDMRVPLRDMPWQILAHLADSVVPVAEREWALRRYQERKTEGLRDLFGAVPYTLDPKRGDAPCTLESFLEYGGACTHNVQFAGGVFDAFGIPSGWAGGPGHTYPYWFELDRKRVVIHRTNELGTRSGKIRDPLSPGHVWEDELRLLTEALNHSIPGHRRAAIAAWAYRRVEPGDQASAAVILAAAVEENPYTYEALMALADATRARQLPPGVAGRAWSSVVKALGDRPHDLPALLDRALPGPGAAQATFAGDDALLKRLGRQWEKAEHGGLALQVKVWRGRALAARGKRAQASGLLREVAQESAATDFDLFAAAMETLCAAYPGGPDSDARLEALGEVISKLGRPVAGEWTELHRSRRHVLRKWMVELGSLGREGEAAATWYAELADFRGTDPGVGATPVLVGGGGGAEFMEAPQDSELVGLRVATTGWSGHSVIGSVQGLYLRGGEVVAAERYGAPRSGVVELRAPAGWRVAGMIAAGGDRLDGLQLVFVPLDHRRLEVRLSPWVGGRGPEEQLIGGRGVKIVGVRGRAGADVDALGLVGVPVN